MPEVGKGKCGWPRKCLMPAQLTIPDPSSIGKRLHEKPLKNRLLGNIFQDIQKDVRVTPEPYLDMELSRRQWKK